ncbi:MAG: RNA pyrophosphohydrolase [Gammaproteobacteria bacterium RIFCSPHIGHO2_12_FULL_38_11]|nr:MAG: RNA pyrophosphohydrolase [Gammaproteobacteria bacterium RIFCSPHIGHO2_12_FULL_38_11]
MIDKEGFRANVGIIVTNNKGELLWARRFGNQAAWQFPQGGINNNETTIDAMYRELKEELGLDSHNVKLLAESRGWLRYYLPQRFQRSDRNSDSQRCIGQKQKWFLLRLTSEDATVKLDGCPYPEFDQWKWVDYWFPLKQVIFFKRHVYRQALEEFECVIRDQLSER